MTPDEPPPRPRWQARYPLGTTDAFRSMGTVAAPLLAGFAFTTLVILLTAGTTIRLAGPATFALALATTMFILCIQLTFTGLLYSAPPAERTDWQPRATTDSQTAERVMLVQRKDHQLQGHYLARSRLTYDVGVVSLISALLALVTPTQWLSWRGAAFLVVAASLAVELAWVVGARSRYRPRWLLPSYQHLQSTPAADGTVDQQLG